MWSFADVAFDLRNEGTDDPVVTVEVTTPGGALYVMAELVLFARVMILRGVHMHGDGIGPNGIGPNGIGPADPIVLAHAIMEEMNVHELRVEGAVRTTGAGPGHRPRPFRVRRRLRPAAG